MSGAFESFGASFLQTCMALAVLLLLIGVIYTIWTQMNLKKKRNYFKELHTGLAPGKEVMFCGGIFGTVKEVNDDRVAIKVRSGAVVDVSRYAIQEIVSK